MLEDTANGADVLVQFPAVSTLPVRYEREPRTLMPQIRKMLRQHPVMSRSKMREDLRARGHIGQCRHGGRRLYQALHDMADRGEILLEPDLVTAINLALPRSERPRPQPEPGPRLIRRAAAEKRQKALARRAKRAKGSKPVKVLCTIF